MSILAPNLANSVCDRMKIIRYIAFLLSFIVMMGHDIVPHIHVDEDHAPEHSATLPHSTNNGLRDIENAYSYFQHSSAERNLVYLGGTERKADSQMKVFYPLPFLHTMEHPLVWYANYKKQRFWENLCFFSSYKLNSSSLRGPPSC